MKVAGAAIAVLVLAFGAASAAGQGAPSGDVSRGKTNPAGTGGDDIPGTGGGWGRKYDANGRMREKDYRAELARRIADAEKLAGQPLTDRDRGEIRGAIRSDLIAWRKQYDPRRADYRTMHDRWLVDEGALSADAWAKQQVDWLRAQQQWIVANVGEADTLEAVRVH
jgi:hypothetical protein